MTRTEPFYINVMGTVHFRNEDENSGESAIETSGVLCQFSGNLAEEDVIISLASAMVSVIEEAGRPINIEQVLSIIRQTNQ